MIHASELLHPPQKQKNIIHAVYAGILQFHVVNMVGPLPVAASDCFMDIVKEICPCGDKAINVSILNKINNNLPHARGDHRAGKPEKYGCRASQHLLPY